MSAVAFSVKTRPSFWSKEGPEPVEAATIRDAVRCCFGIGAAAALGARGGLAAAREHGPVLAEHARSLKARIVTVERARKREVQEREGERE